jgi:hypothetical protein
MKLTLAIVAIALSLQGCGGATATPVPQPLRVAALGDSITQAFMCDRDAGDMDCYPRAVQSKAWPAKLAALNPRLNVSSYAAAGCQLVKCSYEFALSAFLPVDYVVMLYGVNESAAGVPVATFIDSLKYQIAARPSKYIIVKPPVHFPAADPATDASIKLLLPQYRAALDSIAGATVIDPLGETDWWCDLKRDQHPCEPAHIAIAKAVNAAL